jgi:glycosyltransferase involved in cell wall biosynthesis
MKILCFTPLPYGNGAGWWGRDLALTVLGFRGLGHDAFLVCYPTTHSKDPEGRPVFLISPGEACSPSWWKNQRPDLVILGLWTRPKYDAIRRAALAATPRVIERADSDGMRTASCGLITYARRRYDYFRDRSYRWPTAFSIPVSALYSTASILATPWIEARLARTLKLIPNLSVETPQAASLWKFLATQLHADPLKIHLIPHPIQTDIFNDDSSIPKKNQIISVGRWESYQKNFPLLYQALTHVLRRNQDWTALVVGSGLPLKAPHARITFSRPLPADLLARRMKESKFFLSSSRYESFGLAAAEALCCACIPIGPSNLTSLFFFRSFLKAVPSFFNNDSHIWPPILPEFPPTKDFATPAVKYFNPKNVASLFLRLLS